MTSFLSVTDLFAGAGGSSTGLTWADVAGQQPEVVTAANHWKLALDSHAANHPTTTHVFGDLRLVHPSQFKRTTMLWASPECTKHSGAAGRKRKGIAWRSLWGDDNVDPEEERSRATMREVVEFAEYHRYDLIIVENVTEIRFWAHYEDWLKAMHRLGYNHREVFLNSMHAHPTPQSRDRIYVCFWKRGNKAPDLEIRPRAYCPRCGGNVEAVWTKKNHEKALPGKVQYGKQYVYVCPQCSYQVEPYYHAAMNIIDWSLPAPKIRGRAKPLAANTLRRIQKGLDKYRGQYLVIDVCQRNPDAGVTSIIDALPTQTGKRQFSVTVPPLMVNLDHTTSDTPGRTKLGTEPMNAVTASADFGVVMPEPFIIHQYGRDSAHDPVSDPMAAVTGFNNAHALIVPKPYVVMNMGTARPRGVDEAMSTVVGSGVKHWLVTPHPFIVEAHGTSTARGVEEALSTVLAGGHHHFLAMPLPFVAPYYGKDDAFDVTEPLGTIVQKAKHGFVLPDDAWDIDECGYRMLTTDELKRAMGFPGEYVILGNDELRTRQIGNAVTPPVAQLLGERMFASLA